MTYDKEGKERRGVGEGGRKGSPVKIKIQNLTIQR